MFEAVAEFQSRPVMRVRVSDCAAFDVPRFGSVNEAISRLPNSTVEAIFDIENGRTFVANNMSEIYEAARCLSEEDVKV